MATSENCRIFDRALDPIGRCLTPDVAARITALRATDRFQRRLDRLAEKNAAGRLTAKENAQYDSYVEALDVIAILQAKARKALRAAGRAK